MAKGSTTLGPVDLSSDIPSQIEAFLDLLHFYIVNTTTMVVNSYTVLYICMEVIICQSCRPPEPQISSGGRRNVEQTLSFWGEFCKILPSQNRIYLTFQIVACWTFHIYLFVNTTAMVVNSDIVLYMCVEVIFLSM